MTDETHRKSQTFDPLDMGNYRIEKLPKKSVNKFSLSMKPFLIYKRDELD